MPVLSNFAIGRYEDGTLTISLEPQAPVGGQNLRFEVLKHFGGVSGFIVKSVSSGFNNQSGINIINSGQGVFNVSLTANDTSGMDYGNYAYAVERLASGSRTILSEGFLTLLPGVGV